MVLCSKRIIIVACAAAFHGAQDWIVCGRNFEWKREKKELEVQERAHTSYLQSLDLKHMALAQEEERAQKAMDALRSAGCTFHGNPFLDL